MARPRVSRPPDSTSREAACLASSTVLRSGPITTMVTSRTRVVTAAAADRAANGSTLGYTIRSSTPRLANGPSSARRAHSRTQRPSAPGVGGGSPTPPPLLPPPGSGPAAVPPGGIMVRLDHARRDHPAGRGGPPGHPGGARVGLPAPPALLPRPPDRAPGRLGAPRSLGGGLRHRRRPPAQGLVRRSCGQPGAPQPGYRLRSPTGGP